MKKNSIKTLAWSLIIYLSFCSFIYAQSATTVTTTSNSQTEQAVDSLDNLFKIYQVTNDNINRTINYLSFAITALSILVAIFAGASIYKQVSLDREMDTYKKAIQQRRVALDQLADKMENTYKALGKKESEIDKRVAKILTVKGLRKTELNNVQINLEKLKEDIKRLRDETHEARIASGASSVLVSGMGESLFATSKPDNAISIPLTYSVLGNKICQKCSSPNGYNANFCSNCGNKLTTLN